MNYAGWRDNFTPIRTLACRRLHDLAAQHVAPAGFLPAVVQHEQRREERDGQQDCPAEKGGQSALGPHTEAPYKPEFL